MDDFSSSVEYRLLEMGPAGVNPVWGGKPDPNFYWLYTCQDQAPLDPPTPLHCGKYPVNFNPRSTLHALRHKWNSTEFLGRTNSKAYYDFDEVSGRSVLFRLECSATTIPLGQVTSRRNKLAQFLDLYSFCARVKESLQAYIVC